MSKNDSFKKVTSKSINSSGSENVCETQVVETNFVKDHISECKFYYHQNHVHKEIVLDKNQLADIDQI